MKQIYVMIAGVLALIAGLATCSLFLVDDVQGSPLPATLGSAETEFELSTGFPEIKDVSYPMYQTDVPVVTVQSVEGVARLFGMTGKAEVSNPKTGELLLVDDSKDKLMRLSMYPTSGAILYEVPEKQFPNVVKEQPPLPSRDEAIKIADAFLKERELYPSDARVTAVEVNQKQEVWQAGGSEPEEVYDVTLAVRYGRELDGVPVYGDEMAVIIGESGDVVGMVKCWREVEVTGETTIISAEKAYESLKAGKTTRPREMGGYDRVTIEEISLGYWMEPRIFEQDIVMPVWVFSGTAYYEGSEELYQEYVKAVE
jgi:hypothetical protein